MSSISPLKPKSFADMSAIKGVSLAVTNAGVKYTDRDDVLLVELSKNTDVAGVFTQSQTASANVIWGKESLAYGKARVLVVNSGNANAFNGKSGEESVARIVKFCSDKWQCNPQEIYPCATGVIGEPLPDDKITDVLSSLKDNLVSDHWLAASRAIMTTDTFPKYTTRYANIAGTPVTINGIAKGSGMIAPNMATLLSYIFTDADISASVLQKIIKPAIDSSFNSITVDSDTSTSDTALIFATGQAQNPRISKHDDPALEDFKVKLNELLLELAHMVVKDGEGASKFIKITVTGAEDNAAAKIVALSIGNSPLVKTAIAGEDANWGRIVMAVGKAGQKANRDKMSVAIGGITIAENGQLNPSYTEDTVTSHMQQQNIEINTDIGVGQGTATIWTCDLTHGYITINADYRS